MKTVHYVNRRLLYCSARWLASRDEPLSLLFMQCNISCTYVQLQFRRGSWRAANKRTVIGGRIIAAGDGEAESSTVDRTCIGSSVQRDIGDGRQCHIQVAYLSLKRIPGMRIVIRGIHAWNKRRPGAGIQCSIERHIPLIDA